jgi:FkbM family methyltransferase
MIDVGAELGSLADSMLRAGVEDLHAFDPHPANAGALLSRFREDPRVTVHELAVSDADGSCELHVSSKPDGTPLSFGHTLLQPAETDEIAWRGSLSVGRRSLQSLLDAGEIPPAVGILKIDTEGHDLAVVRGMGKLQADVVMVEHWTDLPQGLGVCPWSTDEMVGQLRDRGFSNFAFIMHRSESVILKWNDGQVETGAMGNLVFLHDRILERALPEVLVLASDLAEQALIRAERYARVAGDRLALVDELKRAAEDRLTLVNELKQAAEDRLTLINELTQAADERLALINDLSRSAG